MKILITGASGLLGRAVMRELEDVNSKTPSNSFHIQGLAHRRAKAPLRSLDLTQRDTLKLFLDEEQPDWILHCAAERRPDISEKDPQATTQLNVEVSRQLAHWCAESKSGILYLSTDYVFDGTASPYSPEARPRPLNHYGMSKWGGELAVMESGASYAILRVPILHGPTDSIDESSITKLYSLVKEKPDASVEHWATRFPTFTPDVAYVIRQMLEKLSTNKMPRGIYHFSGSEPFTKYEMAVVIAELCKLDASQLEADPNLPSGAPRPKNTHLDCSKLESLVDCRRTSFRDSIQESLRSWI